MTEHRTLFAIDVGRERAQKRMGGRAPKRSAGRLATSDVRRHRPMWIAAITAMLGVLVGWRVTPSTSSTRGALALPHAEAQIACAACHGEEGVTGPAPVSACKGCHGAHASLRAGHRALAADGRLGCVRCHDVHGDDQGVRFASATGEALRYAVGASTPIEGLALPSHRAITVPLIPVSRCAGGCHDPSAASDPIGRCLSQDGRLSLCFDEHQTWSAVAPIRPGGVCASQHDNDRFAAWEAARQVAAAAPAPEVAKPTPSGLWWLLSGVLGGALGALGYAGTAFVRRRAKRPDEDVVAKPAERARLPQIDTNTCLGCYACVDACPYDVLVVERYVARVARPEMCCGLSLCEQVCPNGSLVITDGDPIGDRPRLGDDLSARGAPGVYLAGDVTGLPLIKNAIRQGKSAIENIARGLGQHDAPLDVVIVGAGPAGISAALQAKELGLRYAVIEQGSVAESIRSFPRGKLVFDQPLELPVTGKLWLAESTKEELLAKWLRIIREEKIEVRESTRFTSLDRDGDVLVVNARGTDDDAELALRSARLLLAIGVRGSPRKLPIALSPAMESKVFYHLADARSFVGRRVVVVGLGDVAMECAIALAHQPDCMVSVVHRGAEHTRGKQRNIAELRRLVAAGRVEMFFSAEVRAVEEGVVTVSTEAEQQKIPNDVVFVMIGSNPPAILLEKAGVEVGIAV